MNETGFDTYFFRPYARSPKGEIVKTKISGRKYQRLSLVAAQIGQNLIAPMIYQDTMTSDSFEAWFETMLLPNLPEKSLWANIKKYMCSILPSYDNFTDALLSYFYFN